MRPDRLSPDVHPVKDYLRQLGRDPKPTAEDKRYLRIQAARLLREFADGSASDQIRLACGLAEMELARDRTLPAEKRITANRIAANIMAGLRAIRYNEKGRTHAPVNRRRPASVFEAAPGALEDAPPSTMTDRNEEEPLDTGRTAQNAEDEEENQDEDETDSGEGAAQEDA